MFWVQIRKKQAYWPKDFKVLIQFQNFKFDRESVPENYDPRRPRHGSELVVNCPDKVP